MEQLSFPALKETTPSATRKFGKNRGLTFNGAAEVKLYNGPDAGKLEVTARPACIIYQ
ncbi:MAG: hypothetical protein R2941_14340 [Desulfobacterales bacterium]